MNLDNLINIAVNYSAVIIVLSAIAFVNYVFVQRQSMPDYMTFAYMIVTPIMICAISVIQGRKLNLLWAVIGYILILVGGCRGALLTVSLFFLFALLSFLQQEEKQKRLLLNV